MASTLVLAALVFFTKGIFGTPLPPSQHLNGTYNVSVYGGQPAQEGQFPWQVYIEIGTMMCGGSIINPKTIATAAHCIFDKNGQPVPPSQISVYAGSIYPKRGWMIPAEKALYSSSYPTNHKNDVAVIHLQWGLSYNSYIQPIQLMPANQKDISGQCYLSGFGSTTVHGGPVSDVLRWTIINLRPDRDCHYDRGNYDDASMVCAGGNGGGNLCAGDSGGPLACSISGQMYLYGVVSRGPIECSSTSPGIYESVSYWNSFYTTNMAY